MSETERYAIVNNAILNMEAAVHDYMNAEEMLRDSLAAVRLLSDRLPPFNPYCCRECRQKEFDQSNAMAYGEVDGTEWNWAAVFVIQLQWAVEGKCVLCGSLRAQEDDD